MKKPDMMLWLDDHRGVYIPRDFVKSLADWNKSVSGVDFADVETLANGPDEEGYWDAWANVCDNAIVTDENGVKYRVYQDGDCWLVPEGMEWSDEEDTFVWPGKDAA